MGTTSSRSPLAAVRHGWALTLVAMLATLAGLGLASPAKSAPVSLTFDHGRISIGSVLGNRVILPATDTFPSPDLPTPQRTDIQLNGDLTGNQVTIPALTNTGLQLPYMHLLHPDGSGLKIPLTMRLNGSGLTGTWDPASGAMTLEGPVDIIIVTGTGTSFPLPDSLDDLGVPPLGLFARCRINDLPLEFSTETPSPFTGERFTGGFGVNGAMTATFDRLPAASSENGGECDQLNVLLNNPGGIWLSNGIAEPKPQPPPPPPTCETDITVCPPPRFVEIDGVRLKPGRKTVRRGQKVTMTLRVHNSGNLAAKRIRVRIRTTNKAFRSPRTVTLTVPPESWARKRFRVKIKRNAKGRGFVRAAKNGWVGNSFLKVKPKKKGRARR